MIRLVLEDLDTAWSSVILFSENYIQILTAFGNACGQVKGQGQDDGAFSQFLRGKRATEWIYGRLDELELQKVNDETNTERYGLVQLLVNLLFGAGGEDKHIDRFLRAFGQEYLLRERDGSHTEAMTNMITNALGMIPTYQALEWSSHSLLLLRPCGNPHNLPYCAVKEKVPHASSLCECKRRAFCSPACAAA